MKVAILGLGIIGSRVAARLAAGGADELTLWNRTPKGLPGEAADLAEAVAGREVVSLYLKDREALRSVVEGFEDAAPDGLRLLNHSTVDLETTRWLAARSAERGWDLLDAPFTGSRDAARDGKLVYYVGGGDETIDALEPFLLRSGRAVVRCGGIGSATILKLATNLVSACTVQALSEALAVATRQGLAPEAFTAAVAENACGSPLAAMKLPGMAAGEFETHFSLANMLKDSRYALELAGGLDTPAIAAVSRRMRELADAGLGGQDYSVLMAPYLDR